MNIFIHNKVRAAVTVYGSWAKVHSVPFMPEACNSVCVFSPIPYDGLNIEKHIRNVLYQKTPFTLLLHLHAQVRGGLAGEGGVGVVVCGAVA